MLYCLYNLSILIPLKHCTTLHNVKYAPFIANVQDKFGIVDSQTKN